MLDRVRERAFRRLCAHKRWVEINDDPATIETFDRGRRVEVVFAITRYRCLCCGKEVKEMPASGTLDFSMPSGYDVK